MKDFKISVSLLSADFVKLYELIGEINKSDIEMIHLDICDGVFVDNISIGLPVVRSVARYSQKPLDVHLMISKPEKYIKDFADAGADIITVHAEATDHIHRLLDNIHACGKKAGVALNPGTDFSFLKWILNDIDLVLQMTVDPGFGGQKYISEMNKKIEQIRGLLDMAGHDIFLEADGGINSRTISEVVGSGADLLVMGSAIINTDDIIGETKRLRSLA